MNDPASAAFWSVSTDALLASLNTTAEGLGDEVAKERLAQYGPNTIGPATDRRVVRLLLSQFGSPIVLLLIGAAILSVILHDPTDGAIVMAIVVASGILGFWQE
jgi:Mg2+-importing ATPase